MKKVIILYSTGGLGHKKAALALYDAFKKANGIDAEIVDVLEYGNRVYKFLYLDFYVFLMTRARWLWGVLYYFSNIRSVDTVTRRMRSGLDCASMPGLGDMLMEKDPEAVVATHFLLPSIACILKKKGLGARLYALITDYGPHAWWLSDCIDRFFVGAGPVAEEVAGRGVPRERITVTGIPVTDEFRKGHDKGKLRAEYGLDPGKKTVFMMSGGFGVGPMEEMLLSLNDCRAEIQVITVCGHNKEIYEDIKRLKEKLRYQVVLFGFTDKVAELMAVSDLMITKAGGISTTEAMDSRLPMILYASIPGQETWNEELLTKFGAAEKAKKAGDIPAIADRMLLSEDAYEAYVAGIDKVRKPDAAKRVVDIITKDMT